MTEVGLQRLHFLPLVLADLYARLHSAVVGGLQRDHLRSRGVGVRQLQRQVVRLRSEVISTVL